MGKKDYTRYTKRQEPETVEIIDSEVSEVGTVEDVHVEEVETVTKIKNGVVTDCMRLNVRKEPSLKSDIVCVIDCLTEVIIDEKESTNEFYKICTVSGIEGFCMKKFVAIR